MLRQCLAGIAECVFCTSVLVLPQLSDGIGSLLSSSVKVLIGAILSIGMEMTAVDNKWVFRSQFERETAIPEAAGNVVGPIIVIMVSGSGR